MTPPLCHLGHFPKDNNRRKSTLSGSASRPTFNLSSLLSIAHWVRTSSSAGVHFFALIPGPRKHLIPWHCRVALINFSPLFFELLGIYTYLCSCTTGWTRNLVAGGIRSSLLHICQRVLFFFPNLDFLAKPRNIDFLAIWIWVE